MAIQVPTGPSRHPGPFGLLTAAIRAVPAVKWALGVAGVAAALALSTSFFGSVSAALLGSLAMIGLMTLLVIFAAMSRLGPLVKPPALVLTWTVLILTSLSSVLTFSCIFFEWPKKFSELVTSVTANAKVPRNPEVEVGDATHTRRRSVSRVLAGASANQSSVAMPNCPVSELCQELEVRLTPDLKVVTVVVQAKDSDATGFTVCKPDSYQSFIECGAGSSHLDQLRFLRASPRQSRASDGTIVLTLPVVNWSVKTRVVRMEATVE